MSTRRDKLERIEAERTRHLELPGSECDALHSPSDWTAIASHYLSEEVRRGCLLPDREAFENSLVKAAAVILAALEHVDRMADKGMFR